MTVPPSTPQASAGPRLARLLPGPLAPMGGHHVAISQADADHRCHALLFTRYFLRGFAPKNQPEPGERELQTWFAERQKLFEGYTLPSVIGQRHRSFTWVVLVDEALRHLLPDSIDRRAIDDRIEIVSTDARGQPIASLHDLNQLVQQRIELQLARMRDQRIADPIVTVARLDNDDAIAHDFLDLLCRVALIARQAGQGTDLVVTFPHGLQYLEGREFSTYLFNNNHFLASVHGSHAGPHGRLHALAFNHSHVFTKVPQTLIANTDLPMWVEVVHGENVSNQYRPVAPLRGNDGMAHRFSAQYRVSPIESAPFRPMPLSSVTAPHPSAPIAEPERLVVEQSRRARRQLGDELRAAIAASGAMKPAAFATVYESVLSRVETTRLFEIGIHQGGSIRLWRELLGPSGAITCMDIKQEACATAAGMADHVYTGSQTDPELLDRICGEAGPFDLVIDDGSHQNPHMVFSFEHLFPHVRPGGAYVIEDMFTSYWPKYRGGLRKRGSLVEHVKNLVDKLYAPFVSAKYKAHFLAEAIPQLEASAVSEQIESIEFFAAGIVVIHKRAAV